MHTDRRPERWAVALVLALLSSSAPAGASGEEAAASAEPQASLARDETLAALESALAEAEAARGAGEHARARALVAAAIDGALEELAEREDEEALALLARLGAFAHGSGELRGAERARRHVLEVRTRSLPDDHPDLQAKRQSLAATLYLRGDLAGARPLYEKVLEVRTRSMPDDDPDLQTARANLAATLYSLGDFAGARALDEAVLEVRSRSLPDDHPDLQAARQGLAATLHSLGDLAGARALCEKVLEVRSRSLPDDHPTLQRAQLDLAATLYSQGDLAGARAFQEKVLEARLRSLPDDHPDLQRARVDLGATLYSLGDLPGARALQEKVLEVRSRSLPDDHPYVQAARENLAVTIQVLGDLASARALQERVLEFRSRSLPADHPQVQVAKANLAVTIRALGDLAGARSLEEQVLAVRSRSLPDDHPVLQAARGNLAGTIKALGDLAGARALQEKVLEVDSRSLPADHPDLQAARGNLALTILALGDLAGARRLQEQTLEVLSRSLPADHPDLQTARRNLASTIRALGDLAGARALQEQVLEVFSRALPDDAPGLQQIRQSLAVTIAAQGARAPGEREGGRERCVELLGAACASQARAARSALLEASPREAEARCRQLANGLDYGLSLAGGLGAFPPSPELERPCFELSEITRGAALGAAALMRLARGSPRCRELRDELAASSAALVALAQQGTTSEEFQRALTTREALERELVGLGKELSGAMPPGIQLDLEALSARLGERDALVAYLWYERWSLAVGEEDSSAAWRESFEPSLGAFVLRPGRGADGTRAEGGQLAWIELGPLAPIEEAVRAWRAAIGAGIERGMAVASDRAESARGAALRTLVLDPLLPALGEAERLILVLDDVLHLVPLDAMALEASDAGAVVGDRWRTETRRTSAELLAPVALPAGGALVALGGASFNSEPLPATEEDLAAIEEPAGEGAMVASILRGGAWSAGFSPLTYTGLEAREIAALHEEVLGEEAPALVLERRKASRAALEELAPRARWLHVATHGWYASESIRSWEDLEPLDKLSGLGLRQSGEEQVKGMSPMLLCGLALAGANLPEDAVGRAPGLITAEELSTLDLTGCELAVLSACDTNVGVRRAGQGVASLQRALQMAGARSVITSLWKVPDEATRELMLDFYRRLWVEGKPKHQALWEAKMRLRDARDERGEPLYTLRDWAAWVLTGEPD